MAAGDRIEIPSIRRKSGFDTLVACAGDLGVGRVDAV
jgi:hypothetical protein